MRSCTRAVYKCKIPLLYPKSLRPILEGCLLPHNYVKPVGEKETWRIRDPPVTPLWGGWQGGRHWVDSRVAAEYVSVYFSVHKVAEKVFILFFKNRDVAHTCCQWSIRPFSMTTSHALVASRWVVPIKSVFGQRYRITTWRSYQMIAGPHRKTNNHLHSPPLLCWLVFGLWEPGELGESPCSHGVTM